MELISNRKQHRVHLRVGQHRIEFSKHFVWPVLARRGIQQVLRRIADCVNPHIARLLTGFKMRHLRNGPGSQYADVEEGWFFQLIRRCLHELRANVPLEIHCSYVRQPALHIGPNLSAHIGPAFAKAEIFTKVHTALLINDAVE